jgi:membrane-associated protein
VFNQLVDQISGSGWSYVLIFVFAYLDALVPLVPSETAVITAGVLAGSGKMNLPAVIALAACGAFAGDNTAYLIGRHYGEPAKRRFFSGEKARKRIAWAERQVQQRGGELIVVARFIPAGRTVVTLSAGGLRMPWRRFALFDAIAAVVWASYASLLGYFGGKAFEHQPWKGLLLALGIAFAVTGTIELVRWLRSRRRRD